MTLFSCNLWLILGLYRNSALAPDSAEIWPFSQIQMKSGSCQNFGQISGFSHVWDKLMLPDNTSDISEVQFKTD